MDAVSSHPRVSVHTKQNRMNVYLSEEGVHVASKEQSNRGRWHICFAQERQEQGEGQARLVSFGLACFL